MRINEDNIAGSWYQNKLSSRFWSIGSPFCGSLLSTSRPQIMLDGRDGGKRPVTFETQICDDARENSPAWRHKCDTRLPTVRCRSPNFRSRYTTWKRLRARVNIVITWFSLESLLHAGSVETVVQIVWIPRLPHWNMWVWGIVWTCSKKKNMFEIKACILCLSRDAAFVSAQVSAGKVLGSMMRPKITQVDGKFSILGGSWWVRVCVLGW